MPFPWSKTRPTGKSDVRIYGYEDDSGISTSWSIYGFISEVGSTGDSVRRQITDTSCLTFGGGTRTSPIYTPILMNTYNTSVHLSDNIGFGNNDVCLFPHFNVITRAKNTANGCYVNNNTIITISNTIPFPGEGFMIHYYNTAEVEIVNCEIWAGSGSDVYDQQQKCKFGIVELGTTKASNQWYDVFYGSALGLSQKIAAKNHFWYVAISLMPTAIGFCTSNSIKIEAVYQ